MSDSWLSIAAIPVGLVCVYVVARFISAAYFQSKRDYERKHHGGEK